MTEKSGGGRRYGIIAACAVLALALIAGAYWMGRSAGNGADVGEEAAKLAALGHAQVSESALTRYGITRDRRGGKTVYEVEFTADGVEYDYEIDAADGSVVKFKKESSIRTTPVQTPAGDSAAAPQAPAGTDSAGDIGEERAWEIAYSHAGVAAADVTASPAKLDYEDGIRVYELEFFSGGYEYDYEISAADGSVVKAQREREDRAAVQPEQNLPADAAAAYIGEARAREIAYAHAGVAANAVGHCEVELDHHDDHHGTQRCEYEIDFKSGGYEYEYKIDAVTGEVLQSRRERDD